CCCYRSDLAIYDRTTRTLMRHPEARFGRMRRALELFRRVRPPCQTTRVFKSCSKNCLLWAPHPSRSASRASSYSPQSGSVGDRWFVLGPDLTPYFHLWTSAPTLRRKPNFPIFRATRSRGFSAPAVWASFLKPGTCGSTASWL